MSKDIIDVLMIIDLNEHMKPYESKLLEHYNHLLEQQKEGKGTVRISTVLVNPSSHTCPLLHHRMMFQDVKHCKKYDGSNLKYYALDTDLDNDPLGDAVIEALESLESQVAKQTVVVVVTNKWYKGLSKKVGCKIQHFYDSCGWDFVLLGKEPESNWVPFYPLQPACHLYENFQKDFIFEEEMYLAFDYLNNYLSKVRDKKAINKQ